MICPFLTVFAGDSPSVLGSQVYFIDLKNGDKVKSPFVVRIGLSEKMGIAPAMADWPDTGHHHIIIDAPSPIPNKVVSNKHVNFSMGQTEWRLNLKPGEHTLQIVLGDFSHSPHDPPVMSEVITMKVE